MSLFSFIHEDLRIVRAILKLQNIIAGILANPPLPISNILSESLLINTISALDVLMGGMQQNLGPGVWLVTFSGDVGSNSAVDNGINTSIYVDGIQIPGSNRVHHFANINLSDSFCSFASQARITIISGVSTIEGRWSVSSGQTAFSNNRQMTFIKVS